MGSGQREKCTKVSTVWKCTKISQCGNAPESHNMENNWGSLRRLLGQAGIHTSASLSPSDNDQSLHSHKSRHRHGITRGHLCRGSEAFLSADQSVWITEPSDVRSHGIESSDPKCAVGKMCGHFFSVKNWNAVPSFSKFFQHRLRWIRFIFSHRCRSLSWKT